MTTQHERSTMKPSPRACLACRKRHLRCDGGSPVCVRCFDGKIECIYVQSRRGLRKNVYHEAENSEVPSHAPNEVSTQATFSIDSTGRPQDFDDLLGPLPSEHTGAIGFNELIGTLPSEDTQAVCDMGITRDRYGHLIEIYYRFVHPAHPFILPRSTYERNKSRFPGHLLAAMCYIASHHAPDDPETFRQQVDKVYHPDVLDDLYKVQTLLLLTLTSYARFERDLGNKALLCATATADKIGLSAEYHVGTQAMEPIFQESWRRTWWELYTIGGLISFISGMNFRLPLPEGLLLPGDDELYNGGREAPSLGTSVAMQQRFFAEGEENWSSFAYRIEAMRLLNTAQVLMANDAIEEKVDALNASITSFILSLPKDKEEGLKKHGEIDEVMSCSLMIIHLARICLHMRQSDIGTIQGLRTVCGNQSVSGVNNFRQVAHRTACVESAKEVSRLVATRTTLETLSPCFSCAIAYSAIIQLADNQVRSTDQALLKEHLKMLLSVLRLLGKTWPIADVLRGQIAQFSREIFLLPQRVDNSKQFDIFAETWMQDLLSESLPTPSGDFTTIGF